MNNKKPNCYSPERDNPYPLCVGNGGRECEKCDWYKDLRSPYDEDIYVVTLKETTEK